MSNYTYKITKKDKNVNNIEILKSGLEAKINFLDIARDIRRDIKMRTEIQSDKAMMTAMVENIKRNYSFVLKFTPDQLKTITLYAFKMQGIEDCNTDLKTLKKNFDTYESDIPAIKKALNITEETEADMALSEAKGAKDVAGDALKNALKKVQKHKNATKSKKS